jgi:hypothetical protein
MAEKKRYEEVTLPTTPTYLHVYHHNHCPGPGCIFMAGKPCFRALYCIYISLVAYKMAEKKRYKEVTLPIPLTYLHVYHYNHCLSRRCTGMVKKPWSKASYCSSYILVASIVGEKKRYEGVPLPTIPTYLHVYHYNHCLGPGCTYTARKPCFKASYCIYTLLVAYKMAKKKGYKEVTLPTTLVYLHVQHHNHCSGPGYISIVKKPWSRASYCSNYILVANKIAEKRLRKEVPLLTTPTYLHVYHYNHCLSL